MRKLAVWLAVAGWLTAQVFASSAQSTSGAGAPCPTTEHSMDAHHTAVNMHGDEAMGFGHEKTTHHFFLAAGGGSIEVRANDAHDSASIDAIRSHLNHIAQMFASGDFSAPAFVHSTIPPGVTTMKLLKSRIEYKYEALDGGGRVRIESSDPVAVAAVHDFLRFQIIDHQTGDAQE